MGNECLKQWDQTVILFYFPTISPLPDNVDVDEVSEERHLRNKVGPFVIHDHSHNRVTTEQRRQDHTSYSNHIETLHVGQIKGINQLVP